ncbi:hypothetical protein GALMADRAFT_241361 [Galerina marginata CBS 339.88]|uniref:Carrier domain-containing protein n=1 Tax=Galerina marginata (strain CBS 339.88) TaxID=685588 RepID=A0A067TEV1_GALM3|nr:hypothetical protein GALMADRAFT_241361 [Galerina marginata CBS 339.88]
MAAPLASLDDSTGLSPKTLSFGENFGDRLSKSSIKSLLDSLCQDNHSALYSSDIQRGPLHHSGLRAFIAEFVLPHSKSRPPLGKNDRVMLALPAGPENALALLALSNYHTCAPVNPSCTAAELKEDISRIGAKAVLTTKDAAKRLELKLLQDELHFEIIYIQARSVGPAGLFDMSVPGGEGEVPLHPSEPHGLDDISLVLHTSGTSGKKKVVRYSLRTLLVGAWCVVQSWNLKADDINLNMMPLFHVGGIVRNLFAPVLSGGSSIVCAGFDPTAFWLHALELRATWYYAAPTVHHAILSAKPDAIVPSKDLNIRLICNAAGGLLPSLASELRDAFGATVLPSYGMTECMPIATPPIGYKLDRPGCSGVVCGPYLSIREPSNLEQPVMPGAIGAVCVRGLPTFEGYEKSSDITVPLDTSSFSSQGWFDSGDMGYLDEDGYLYITGRSKEIINKGGEVVSPFEIEEAVAATAKEFVKVSLAFSIEHDVLQESIGLVVVPSHNQSRVDLRQLHDLLMGHLHPSKWPFAIVYMDDIPKNSAGKPLRIGLAQRLGIGQLTDHDPLLHRHFEAILPPISESNQDPIPCKRVPVDRANLYNALKDVPGVNGVALRHSIDGSVAAYVSVAPTSALSSDNVSRLISQCLPGYIIPTRIHVVHGPLLYMSNGGYDFERMEKGLSRNAGVQMTKRQILVRDIVADVLNMDSTDIQNESDFFLLGGNSLLLGKLSYHLRRQSGLNVGITELFSESTVRGIASLIEEKENAETKTGAVDGDIKDKFTPSSSTTALSMDYDYEQDIEYAQTKGRRSQDHPLCLIVQAIPFLFFHPLKSALRWSLLVWMLCYFAPLFNGLFWERMVALLTATLVARLATRTVSPIVAIACKWIIIGRYKPGKYRMWSIYYLRWWIVNQILRTTGRGIFSYHPSLVILYYRLLGANIGQDVLIDEHTKLFECDLLTFEDGCHVDTSTLRGFCVERGGCFTLAPITIGRKAFVNTYTNVSPGSHIPDGSVYGPHASSHDGPSPKSYAAYNRTLSQKPTLLLRIFVAWPVIAIVTFISYIPWMLAIFVMLNQAEVIVQSLNELESVIYWFAEPERVLYHLLSTVVRALFRPLIQLGLGIMVKRAFGFNTENQSMAVSQLSLLRRYINSSLLSKGALNDAFAILGTHYEIVSIVYRAMGAKIGKRIYWPGSGILCPDPELLDIGDDVVFGSRSALITTDRLGSGKIVIESGAMIADRVILLPKTQVGRGAVMGSGSLGKRNTEYEAGSTWIGNENGEAVRLSKGPGIDTESCTDTCTPFGRAFYKNDANYFVFPYPMILCISILATALSAIYWTTAAVGTAQILRDARIHHLHIFRPRWYRYGLLYGLISICFVIILSFQGLLSILWVIATKWLVIKQRRPGRYDWDQSSYCQRWQLHLILSRIMHRGYGYGGVLAPLTGSAYIVWYLRTLGANIGENCAIWAGGRPGLMTEPDLVELGDEVNLDDCSVVAHINSRGRFSLNKLKIGNQCAMRVGSRLLSGASMEDNSMLAEHTLLTSGDVADFNTVYFGWPAKPLEEPAPDNKTIINPAILTCPICRRFPKDSSISECGHLFCQAYVCRLDHLQSGPLFTSRCIARFLINRQYCPVCFEPSSLLKLKRVHLSFTMEGPRQRTPEKLEGNGDCFSNESTCSV